MIGAIVIIIIVLVGTGIVGGVLSFIIGIWAAIKAIRDDNKMTMTEEELEIASKKYNDIIMAQVIAKEKKERGER